MANEEEIKEPVVYRYKPNHPDEGFVDVPRRDLTQSDVDALVGDALRHVTAPEVENPIYVAVKPQKAGNKPSDDKKGGD